MVHKMRLHPNPFRMIRDGSQQIESRINDEKRKQLKVGDEIEFTSRENPNDKFTVRIVDLIVKPTFDELYGTNPPEMFGGKSKDELMGIYKYYSKEEEAKYGVVGIKVQTI